MAERARGGVALSVVLPGLPQLLAGRLAAGVAALGLWLGAIVILTTRVERVSAALGSAGVEGFAPVALLGSAGLAWAWSLWDVSRESAWSPVGVVRLILDDRWATTALVVLLFTVWAAATASLLTPLTANPSLAFPPRTPPSWTHPMGIDGLGRDVFFRYLLGIRISLAVGVGAGVLGVGAGVVVGAVAGYAGGWVDRVAMRTVDFFIAFPKLVLLIAVVSVMRPSFLLLAGFIAFTQWPGMARIVRGEVAALKQREFVHAVKSLGFSRRRIVVRHLLPNVQGPILVGLALGVANAMLIEAGLAYLGLAFGLEGGASSWGVLIRDGADLLGNWWIGGFAGVSLVVIVVALNLVADAVRDALDPRLRVQI